MANTLLLSGSAHFTTILRPAVDSFQIQWRKSNPSLSPTPSFNLRFTPPLLPSYSVKVKCTAKPALKPKPKPKLDIHPKDPNPIWVVILNSLKKSAFTLVVFLGVLLMTDPVSAWAASGGRMGGRSSSSRSSSGSSSSWSSSGSSSSRSSSSRSSSSPSLSYSSYSYSSSNGDGSRSNSAGTNEKDKEEKAAEELGWTLFNFIIIALAIVGALALIGVCMEQSEQQTSVFKLQVGLLGMAKSLQSDLNSIAETADTSKSDGLKYILTETTVVLLRHPDYFVSACSSANVKSNSEEGEKWFNQLSIEERGKFDEETLVNVDNKRIQRPASRTTDGFNNEYIVVTILVTANGNHTFPTIEGSKDLKDALKMLGSIPSSQIEAVEVLWTPQAENDTLSEKELHEDYPLLRPL